MNEVFAVLPDQHYLTKPFIMKKMHEVNIKSFFQSNSRSSAEFHYLFSQLAFAQRIGRISETCRIDAGYQLQRTSDGRFNWDFAAHPGRILEPSRCPKEHYHDFLV